MNRINSIPCLYGAIVLVFPAATPTATLDKLLPCGKGYQKYTDCIECVLVEVRDFYSFEIDDLLTQLFAQCNLEEMQSIITSQQAKALIDISFHHCDTFPALVFEGKNMEIIHKLCANISIDLY